jgi:hypothetical protein
MGLARFSCLSIALIVLAFMGCDLKPRHSQEASTQTTPCQRFAPINVPIPREPSNPNGMPWVGALALDTETGQVCYTYKVVNHTENAMFPNAPDCYDLYLQTKAAKTSERLDREPKDPLRDSTTQRNLTAMM